MELDGNQKRILKKKLGEKCIYCGCTNTLILTIDHRTPKSRGGGEEEKNKSVTCFICNQLKGSLTHPEFKIYYKLLQQLKGLCKVKLEIAEPKLRLKHYNYPGGGVKSAIQTKPKLH